MQYDRAHALAQDIRQSEEYQTYHRLREEVNSDETTAALLKEHKKLSAALQMMALAGQQPPAEDMQRFQGLTTVLFANPAVSQYMMAEMRLQQMLGDILKIITEAADLDIPLPGIDG